MSSALEVAALWLEQNIRHTPDVVAYVSFLSALCLRIDEATVKTLCPVVFDDFATVARVIVDNIGTISGSFALFLYELSNDKIPCWRPTEASPAPLVDALSNHKGRLTTIDPSDKPSVLRAACQMLHSERMERLRRMGETVCDYCDTHVMEQFMECSCACMSPPRDPVWILRNGAKERRTPLTGV